MNWLTQSVLHVILVVVPWLSIGFFKDNFGVKPDVFVVWYYVPIMIATVLLALWNGDDLAKFAPPVWVAVSIFVIGLTFGAAANLLLFHAVANAPNPGIPVAIGNGASILVFFVAAGLAVVAPKYFHAARIDIWSVAGLGLVVAGVLVFALRPQAQ